MTPREGNHMDPSYRRLLPALLLVHLLLAVPGHAPAQDANVDDAPDMVDELPRCGDCDRPPRAFESITFVGHWAKHAVFVACAATEPERGEPPAQDARDRCTRCVVLPERFELFEPRRASEPLACSDRLALPEGTSPALQAAAATFRVASDGSAAGSLAALGVRELILLPERQCGIASFGPAPPRGLQLEWIRIVPPVSVRLPPLEPAATELTSCVPLGDGTLAVALRRVIDEDPWEETAALVRLRPPPGAFDHGWLAGPEAQRVFRPVGFSRLGKLAWLDVPPSSAPPAAPMRLTVADLVTDRVALRAEVPLGPSDRDRVAAEDAILRHLRAAEIAPPWPLEVQPFPVAAGGVAYGAALRSRGDSCELYLTTADGRSKRLTILDAAVAHAAARVEGAILSPFEPRAAVVVSYEDAAGGRAHAVVGTHLTSGLEPRPPPPGECGALTRATRRSSQELVRELEQCVRDRPGPHEQHQQPVEPHRHAAGPGARAAAMFDIGRSTAFESSDRE
jgi:hypothetical protein